MGFSPEYCVSATRSLLQQNSNPSGNVTDASGELANGSELTNDDTANTMHLLVLFRAVDAMLETCGVYDFTLTDLVRPDPQRIRRILSAVINYARFREEHLKECEPLVRICEGNMEEVRKIEDSNNQMANHILNLKERLDEEADGDEGHRKSTLIQLRNFNSRLEQELMKLQRKQEKLTQEHGQYKEEKAILFEKLEDQHYLIGESAKDLEKLKSYSIADPALIKRIVEELKGNLREYEELLRSTEEVSRNTTKTINSIQLVEDELRNLIKIVQEISHDIRKLEEARSIMGKKGEELEQKAYSSEELAVLIQRADHKLNIFEEKLQKVRQQAEEKEQRAKEKVDALEVEYNRLSEKRETKENQLNQMNEEINKLESLMNRQRNEFEEEWKRAESAVAKLNAHIRTYLSDINNLLD